MANFTVSSATQPNPIENVSVAFSSALSDFKAGLSDDGMDEVAVPSSLSDLKIALSDVEREQSKRKSLRNLAKIRPLIDALENYSKVVEVFVNVKPAVLAFIWGPIKLCVQVQFFPNPTTPADTKRCRSALPSSKRLMPLSMPTQILVPVFRSSESSKMCSARMFLFKRFWSMSIKTF